MSAPLHRVNRLFFLRFKVSPSNRLFVRQGVAVRSAMTPKPFRSATQRWSGASTAQDHQVLVIDDDEMVRKVVARVLRRRYSVTELRDAESALALLANDFRFDAIVCDLHLSGMSGRTLLHHLESFYPDQAERLVILSGSSRSLMDHEFLEAISTRFLEKPATPSQIERIVEEVVGTHVSVGSTKIGPRAA
jgi:CheY-like chemotaxis protein